MPQATRRLPGIRFEAQPPAPAIVLPRMDVAGFVGYASAGPLDVPVSVDDPAAFARIFGPDQPIAWDARHGETVHAALGPAVRSFFRNGGRRCFVVRVADVGARTTTFQLPGVVALGGGGLGHALLRARSVGAWPDRLRVATSVAASPIVLRPVSYRAGTFDVVTAESGIVQAGDLLRLVFRAEGWTLLATVASAAPPRLSSQSQSEERERTHVSRVTADEMLWVKRETTLAPSLAAAIEWIGPLGVTQYAYETVYEDGESLVVSLGGRLDDAPVRGALVRLSGPSLELWARVAEREPDDARTRLVLEAYLVSRTRPTGLPRSRARRSAERLELEVWTDDGGVRVRLGELGFGRRHPRFLADLPTDERLYADAADVPGQAWPELWRAAAEPRFPLAGPVERPLAYFPLAASLLPEPMLPALPPEGSSLWRSGLEEHRSSVFVDQRLETTRTTALAAQADYIRYVAPDPPPSDEDRLRGRLDDPDLARLRGIHALLGVEQVTMIAVPDAALRGWRRDPPAALLPAPDLTLNGDQTQLEWDPAPTGAEVEVVSATETAFETPTLLYRGTDTVRPLGDRPAVAHWYRARFVLGDEVGPWSLTRGPVGPDPRFGDCDTTLLAAPSLSLSTDGTGLEWTPPPTAVEVELEEATDAAFELATPLYRGTSSDLTLGGRPSGVRWFRARYRTSTSTGPWSASLAVGATPRPGATLRGLQEYTDGLLVSVHRALLRMCAARGDLFALLAVPEHYREQGAIAHAETLRGDRSWPRTDVPPLGEGEAHVLGYGALHFPWLLVTNPDRPDELRWIPPDGPTAGVLAKRAAERGAWIAPANVPLRDVVALASDIAADQRLPLLEAQVNGIERTPRGFLALAADTLGTDEELRSINVRRLLQLLRRLALRHGETYAFEPNGDELRRAAQRGFEAVLGALFRVGAFAGRRPDEGFRVVVSDPPNTEASVDAGRLIVELRVAPSRPLAFLTVRLVRAGDGTVRLEMV